MRHTNEATIDQEAEALVHRLQKISDDERLEIMALGPVPAVVSKIKSVHIRKIYLKGKDRMAMIKLFASVPQYDLSAAISFTMNPVS
jgi:primosomal protein N'